MIGKGKSDGKEYIVVYEESVMFMNIHSPSNSNFTQNILDSTGEIIYERYYPLGTKGALLYLPIVRYWCAFSHAKRNCGNSPGQAFV